MPPVQAIQLPEARTPGVGGNADVGRQRRRQVHRVQPAFFLCSAIGRKTGFRFC